MGYITLKNESQAEYIDRKSRFIARVRPVSTEEEALSFLGEIRQDHTATHHVFAYRLRDRNFARYNDDGEPSGTAGLPVLDVLERGNITDAIIVVSRWFGGTLLGTGGLVRAYTQGCKIALEAAGLVRMEFSVVLRCRVSYPLWNSVQYALQKLPVQIGETVYTEDVAFELIVREKDSEAVMLQLRNLSDGKISCEPGSQEYMAWDL